MAKHAHEKNERIPLIGTPELLLGLMIKNDDDKKRAVHEIISGGPKHKQLYTKILLTRAAALVAGIEKQTGEKFSVQKGTLITSHKDETEVPVPLVLNTVAKNEKSALEKSLCMAPAHEIVAFNALLQVLEWSITAIEKNDH